MAEQIHLAADLGASGGRLLAGRFDGRLLALDEVHRFSNGPVRVGSSMHWDLLGLWQQILTGMRAARERYGSGVRSVGVDTWGVDFGLLAADATLLGNPHHYRDARTDGVMTRALEQVSREEIFAETGLQFLPFNTLFQLLSMHWQRSPLLEIAHHFLMMPDLFHWFMSGERVNERTNASTTQFYNPRTGHWASNLLRRFNLPSGFLGQLVEPGTRLGRVLGVVAEETGLAELEVIVPGTHDTASAVLAVPAQASDPNWCYISSGTWSLLGAELPQPVLKDRCREANFTNEVGVGGSIRLLKNIGGLWLLQEARRAWAARGKEFQWEELGRLAHGARALQSLIDPDHDSFLSPTDMTAAIAEYCRATGQVVPADEGAVARCILESLALKYRYVLESLQRIVDRRLETIHIIGGGTQNRLLCQFTADATARRVLAGPIEATAAGNALVQAMASGAISGVEQAREVVRASFEIVEYLPAQVEVWQRAYERFVSLLETAAPR
jgi:rhamnulokinase